MSGSDVLKMIKDNEVKFVDLRFTDTRGKEQHVTMPVTMVDDELFTDGKMFDGSSIAGWKGINESDMVLMPDPASAVLDPFSEEAQINIRCDILEPNTMQGYERDPRSVAKRAEAYLQSTGIADVAYFGPEPEFFILDDIRWGTDMSGCFVKIDSDEADWNSERVYAGGNIGHRPSVKGGYFPVPPVDSLHDIRHAMCLTMEEMGVPVEVHHHEVATAGQCEIGTKFGPLTQRADWVMIQKYVTLNVAHAYGKTATFMPKPLVGDNGSGMHVHQSLFKDGKNLFSGDLYGGLSETALYYIGGIFKHARALNAITNPSHQQLQAAGPRLRSTGTAGLLGTQPLGFGAYSLGVEPQGPPRRSALPRSDGQSLPGVRGHDDGRSRRHSEQDAPGRRHGQGSLRPARRGVEGDPDRLPFIGSGAGLSGQGSRVPDSGRRVYQRYDRWLHRAQNGRGNPSAHDHSSHRVRYVLQPVVRRGTRTARKPPLSGGFFFVCALSLRG